MRIRIAESARDYRGWTMKTLADELDVDHQTVLYWNQGRSFPRLPMFVRIAALLGCSMHDLVET
jgi:DNA-binding XRE family transcriptional regulator